MKDELSFEASIKSSYGFDDPLLVALEKSGKTLTEIQMIVIPWGNEKSEESVLVNGQEFTNDERTFSGRSQKRVRIREILDASFAAKEQANRKLRCAVKEKNKLAEENNAIERRYKYISEVAKREFGLGLPNKRNCRLDDPNSIGFHNSKKAQNSFDWYMQSFKDPGDDEETFPAIIKEDPMRREIKPERHAIDILKAQNIRRPLKRPNRPRPKTKLIKKEASNLQSTMHTTEPQIKEELGEGRMQLATPSSSPESEIASYTDEASEIVRPADDKLLLMEKDVRRENREINIHKRMYSASDICPDEDIPDVLEDEISNHISQHKNSHFKPLNKSI